MVVALIAASSPVQAQKLDDLPQRFETIGEYCPADRNWVSIRCDGGVNLRFFNDGREGGVPRIRDGAGVDAATWESAPSENNSEIPCSGLTDKPVVVTTGEKYKVEEDFSGQGLYGIGLTRTYRSKNA